jgi:hypothetical protein
MPKEENPWTTAFKELYRSTKDRNISGEKKSELFSQLGRLKKEMGKNLKGAPGELPGEDNNPNIIEIDPLETSSSVKKREKKATGGLVGRGQGRVYKSKITKMF